MALEDLTGVKYIDDLNSANPVGSADPMSDVDAHIRGIKNVLKLTFPNLDGAVSATDSDLSAMVNAAVLLSTTVSELTLLTGKTINLTDNGSLKIASTAVTSTAAELNLLDNQQGSALLAGIAAGGGTADAITATFSPALTLVDKLTVIVEATAANATTTPTFQPNGTVAYTIVKYGNQALAAGDIFGAGHRLILQYDAGNTNWELLNPFKVHDHNGGGDSQIPAGGLASDSVISGKIKTSEGTASGTIALSSTVDVAMNAYSFAPMIYVASAGQTYVYVTGHATDPGTSDSRLAIRNTDSGAGYAYSIDWRYVATS